MEPLELGFSTNWNNKLDCDAYTTLRLYNPKQHFAGRKVNATLKGHQHHAGRIEAVKPFFLDKISPYISYLDTGYSVEECKNIIRRMYSSVDFSTKPLALILVVKDKG